MKVVGLFAGIGGFETGLAAAGHSSTLLCEILPASRAVLESRFLGVDVHDDIRTLVDLPADTEILCAGFPCQDLSQAGRTRGLAGANSGLVREVFRLVERRSIPWIVLENVPFMLQLGGGAAIRSIVDEFERLGYRWAWRVVDTYSFGLPQRRERVLLVASNTGDPANVLLADDRPIERRTADLRRRAHGFYWTEGRGGLGWAVDCVPTLKNGSSVGIPSPPAVLLPSGEIVKPDIRDAERLQGFSGDWTFPAETVARPSLRWGLVGSAVSTPVARWLGDRLAEPGRYDTGRDEPFPAGRKLPRAARFDGHVRTSVRISADPLGLEPPPLTTFLQWPGTLLSEKATAGFLGRARTAKLRFHPGFLDAVERHLDRMSEHPGSQIDAKRVA